MSAVVNCWHKNWGLNQKRRRRLLQHNYNNCCYPLRINSLNPAPYRPAPTCLTIAIGFLRGVLLI
ncbi:MAG: hypothetical protein KC419_20625 [Anaerolineales bacterium]|nr:hypothetical protein [Anaerolineales bacterium]